MSTNDEVGMSIEMFKRDERGYRKWLAANEAGFVINIRRSLNPIDARLHHARCRTINGQPPRGNTWTGAYIKVCGSSKRELERWAEGHAGEIPRCGTCQP